MRELMLGNAAVARGLYEAGCSVVSSYPGTPSTEITEECAKYDEIYCECYQRIYPFLEFRALEETERHEQKGNEECYVVVEPEGNSLSAYGVDSVKLVGHQHRAERAEYVYKEGEVKELFKLVLLKFEVFDFGNSILYFCLRSKTSRANRTFSQASSVL